jgi:hypothetical protein
MNGHLLTLLMLIASQCAPIFADASTPLGTKLLAMLGTVLTLVIADTQKRTAAVNAIVGVAGVAVPVLLFFVAKLHPGTMAFEVFTAIVGVFVRLRGLKSVPTLQQSGFVRLPVMGLLAGLSLTFLALGPGTACHNVTPDQFLDATVDCAKVSPNTSAALSAVETCLLGVVSANYSACLSGLVAEAKWTIDEIACLVAWYAEQQNAKVAASTASLADLEARERANAWLAEKRISIRNSYSGAK